MTRRLRPSPVAILLIELVVAWAIVTALMTGCRSPTAPAAVLAAQDTVPKRDSAIVCTTGFVPAGGGLSTCKR